MQTKSIGEFAVHTGMTAKTLRYYDERGLLTPAEVDPRTGYRRYTVAQIRPAATIAALRAAGMPLEAVQTALDEPDRAPALLAAHVDELAARRAREDSAAEIARGILGDDQQRVAYRDADATAWAGVATIVRPDDEAAPDEDRLTGRAEALAAELHAAGVAMTGRWWTELSALDPQGTKVRVRFAFALASPVPDGFSSADPGASFGTLPARTESVVTLSPDEARAAGEGLIGVSALALTDVLNERGIDRAPIRQIVGEDGRVELAVTVEERG